MQNNDVSVSIIVAVHNAAQYLKECLNSLTVQTLPGIEIILVDDGSTDGSGQICEEYTEVFKNVRTIHLQKSYGALIARKKGLLASTGRYIGFVDADDWVEPYMYEKMFSCLEGCGADVGICSWVEELSGASKIKSHGIVAGHYDKMHLETDVYPKMIAGSVFFEWGIFPVLWDALFKRDLLMRHLLPIAEVIKIASDMACVYPCLLEADSICVIEDPMYHYRQIQGSITSGRMNAIVERESFHGLLNYLNQCLAPYMDCYELRTQLRQYCLFVMIPRMDTLYMNLDAMECLFPFSSVAKGEKVILYGAGKYGTKLYKWLLNSKFCTPILLVDSNYASMDNRDCPVMDPNEIDNVEFDHIVITILFASARYAVYREMTKKYGADRVAMIDEEWIMSDGAAAGFDLRI